MPQKESTPDSAIRVHAEILADIETVRRALTDGDALKAWWSAWAGCAITNVEIEPRKGGSYLIESKTRRGEDHYIKGHFLHLEDKLMVLTWATKESSQMASTVFLELGRAAHGSKTRVTIDHRDFALNAERDRAPAMWTRILAVMARGIPRLDPEGVPPEVAAYLRESSPKKKGGTRK